MVSFSAHCGSHSCFKTSRANDHVAELSTLLHQDIGHLMGLKKSPRECIAVRKIVDALTEAIRKKKDVAAAEMLYAIATYSAFEILDLYIRTREVFDRIAPRRTLLPALISIHPNTVKLISTMQRDARLGSQTWNSPYIGSKPWFTSDAPANVYARAIINGIELNQHLESIEQQQKGWKRFDRDNCVKTYVLPFPRYIEGIDQIPVPISPQSVSQYWRKGKDMILEEMPHFYLGPEWKAYRGRAYRDGAKPGAIKHAIFKDILAALRTIAGANKTENKRRSGKTRAERLGTRVSELSLKAAFG